jgi:hypothetical protein
MNPQSNSRLQEITRTIQFMVGGAIDPSLLIGTLMLKPGEAT